MTTIRVPVTVRQTADGRFVARRMPVPEEAEGKTAEEAVAKLQAEATPSQPVPVNDHPNPWVALTEAFKGDPMVDEWLRVMTELRGREEPIPELELS